MHVKTPPPCHHQNKGWPTRLSTVSFHSLVEGGFQGKFPVCLVILCGFSSWSFGESWVRRQMDAAGILRGTVAYTGTVQHLCSWNQRKFYRIPKVSVAVHHLHLSDLFFGLYKIHSFTNSLMSWPAANFQKELRQEISIASRGSLLQMVQMP